MVPRRHDATTAPQFRTIQSFPAKIEVRECFVLQTPRRIIFLIASSIIIISFCQLIPQLTSNDAQFHTPHCVSVSGCCCESPLARLVHFQRICWSLWLVGCVASWMIFSSPFLKKTVVDDSHLQVGC
jgi:hypothetical protein